MPWLIAASLFFYGWWKLSDLGLMLCSVFANYLIGGALRANSSRPLRQKLILAIGITFNLGLLGYFKYAGFFVQTINDIVGFNIPGLSIALPLGISFYTFQQIVYLVDTSRGQVERHTFPAYLLFVAFFPHLIAGPIVHQTWLIPIFARRAFPNVGAREFSTALTIFCIGLFKKVVIADSVSAYATPVFSAASSGVKPNFIEAWGGALAYTFQLYFDFSAYSDMAVGLALMFGIALPLNFYSPYKATSIIDFWRRWHITLSMFLRLYLYIPLGGNQRGPIRRYGNILLVMLIGGLWHGANWTFVAWGGLHGTLIVLNHAWHHFKKHAGLPKHSRSPILKWVSRAFTFLLVVCAWVIFRSPDWQTADVMFNGMFGQNGLVLPETYRPLLGSVAHVVEGLGGIFAPPADVALFHGVEQIAVLVGLLAIVWFAPSGITWVSGRVPEGFSPTPLESGATKVGRLIAWHPNFLWAVLIGAATLVAILLASRPSEFLYFQF
ncbi:MAG: MBOAT family protein [Nitrospiraceae bacterium]